MLLRAIFIFFLVFTMGCGNQKDSPFSDETVHTARNLNLHNLDVATSLDSRVITIAAFSDVHQNYTDFENVVNRINSTDGIDFVVNFGDMTNQGYNVEYDEFLYSYLKLRYPAFTVVGVHDSLGAGVQLYKKIFGPLDFFFETSDWRFIFFNTANWENPEEFRPQWLIDRVKESTKNVVIITHVSLTERHRFGDQITDSFESLFKNRKVKVALNGHGHKFIRNIVNGTVLQEIPRVEGNQWVLIKLDRTKLLIQKFPEGEKEWVPLK